MFRFSIVRLMLLTMLVAIVVGAYSALRQQQHTWDSKRVTFFPDCPRLLVQSVAGKTPPQIWDLSSGTPRVQSLTLRDWRPAGTLGQSILPLNQGRIFFRASDTGEDVIYDLRERKTLYHEPATDRVQAVSGGGGKLVRASVRGAQAVSMEIVTAGEARPITIPLTISEYPTSADISADGRRVLWTNLRGQVQRAVLEPGAPPVIESDPSWRTTNAGASGNGGLLRATFRQIHPDSQRLATWSLERESRIVIHAFGQGDLLAIPWNKPVVGFDWSADGNRLLAQSEDALCVIDIPLREIVREIDLPHNDLIEGYRNYNFASLSGDGGLIATAVRGQIGVWNVDTGEEQILTASNRGLNCLIHWLAMCAWSLLWGWESGRQRSIARAGPAQPLLTQIRFRQLAYAPLGTILPMLGVLSGVLLVGQFAVPGQPRDVGWLARVCLWVLVGLFGLSFLLWLLRNRHKTRGPLEEECARLHSLSRATSVDRDDGSVKVTVVGQCRSPAYLRDALPQVEAWAAEFFGTPPDDPKCALFLFERYDDYESHLRHPVLQSLCLRVYRPYLAWYICEERLRATATHLATFARVLAAQFVMRRYRRMPLLLGANLHLAATDLWPELRPQAARHFRRMKVWLRPEDNLWTTWEQELQPAMTDIGRRLITHPHELDDLADEILKERYDDLMLSLAVYLHDDPERFARWRQLQREFIDAERAGFEPFLAALGRVFACSPEEFAQQWKQWVLDQPSFAAREHPPGTAEGVREQIVPILLAANIDPATRLIALQAATHRASPESVPALLELLQRQPHLGDRIAWALTCALGEDHGEDAAAWQTAYQRVQATAPLALESQSKDNDDAWGAEPAPKAPSSPPAMLWWWRSLLLGGCVQLGISAMILFLLPTTWLPVFVSLAILPAAVRLISAGMSQRTGSELESLRTQQFCSLACGDVVNFALSYLEAALARRQDVREYRGLVRTWLIGDC
jgi:hypothetical protein